MKTEIFNSTIALYDFAASHITDRLVKKPKFNLGLAAGATTTPLYNRLVQQIRDKKLDISRLNTFNLDEYVGHARGAETSFATYTYQAFAERIGLPESQFHYLNGVAEDLKTEVSRYENLIKASGGIDLQILGIGINGHVGFNEPGSKVGERTRVVNLSSETVLRMDPKEFKLGKPSRGVTLGIANILESKSILLIATGPDKATAIRECFVNPPSEKWPASFLQNHKDVLVLLNREAAKQITTVTLP